MSFYEALLTATEVERNRFLGTPVIQQGSAGNIGLDTYVAFLTQAFHHVSHTVPLLMACGARLDAKQEWLREAIGEYIEEEMGHQEWILNDITACGRDADAVRNGTPHYTTELMISYAYDTINRRNPLGFFGMVLVLEGTSIALATQAADAIQDSLGLPDKAFSYLRSHGALDISHMEFFSGLMNRIDSETDRSAIIHSANMFYRLYGNIFSALPFDKQAKPMEVASHA